MRHFDRTEPVRVYGETREADVPIVSKSRVRTPATYRYCDAATEALLYFLVVFTPWAFGTTQPWSIWTMNIACYLLGALLLAKWYIEWRTGYRPARWGSGASERLLITDEPDCRAARFWTVALAVLTVLTLAYCLISAVNARAVFLSDQLRFEYRDYIKWLPHSYDRSASWELFWSYLGLAFFFWAVCDWLLGKTGRERRMEHARDERSPNTGQGFGSGSMIFPARLRRVLWVLCISGSLLALEGMLQRFDGTGKLLWLVQPQFNRTAESQFGPYAYRSNAATYLNLVWPVCLGFWLGLRRAALRRHRAGGRVGSGNYVVLLPCAVLMAAAPIISTSRGGALVALANIVLAMCIIFFASRRENPFIRAAMLSVFIFILGFSGYLGWDDLAKRMENMFVDQMSNRTEIYRNAEPIARDFPVYGTGPGSFGAIYFLYRDYKQKWAAYLHDDWLETRITFGRVGFGLILAMLGLVATRWLVAGGIRVSWEFAGLIGVAMLGCLVHAKFDFPFQVHSILLLFILLCAILFCCSATEAER